MGEAKRKARHQAGRSWAKGSLTITANGVSCLDWSGTRDDAIGLQRDYLAVCNDLGIDPKSYAKRAAGYLMAFGPPQLGEPRLMPTGFGKPWEKTDIDAYGVAVLWLALREHVPDTGLRLEDVFVGKQLEVLFLGDKEQILAETEREQKGQPFTGGEFQMMVAALSDQYLLDPAEAVCMAEGDLFRLAGAAYPDNPGDDFTYVPRIPHDAAEARAMLQMTTIFADVTRPTADPEDAVRTYAGYTDAELMRGKPGVRVR